MSVIVIIDDEINILKSIQRVLRHQPWEVLTYNNPHDAINDLSGRSDIDVIISDYRMPEIDGVEVLQTLKEYCPDSIRMILSGQVDMAGVLDAINKAEVYRFIMKPWNDDDLVMTIKNAISHNELIKENKQLAETVRAQHREISLHVTEFKRLERESPGITKVKWEDDGSIDMSDEF
ncbi:response regulator [Alkalimarinus alittae]|uniref:Response regulator n=1 Tax=Alkalimarinus alittae TaxID=2961619 RepID=A0ABY6N5X1_9ALTE|nr:response regulator [Alkalimarinus alittae]UZE97404.1 response regulator [Alkalimarinus alittae]